MNMFLDKEHEEYFAIFRSEMNEKYQNNKEYLSVVYIMSGNLELHMKIRKHFDPKKGVFFSDRMFELEDLSSGAYVLAKLAVNLFNNNEVANPLDMISSLDDRNFMLALNAMKVRRFGIN